MAQGVDLTYSLLKRVEKAKAALANTQPLMKKIGALIAAESQRSFTLQRLGDYQWPARYEGMSDPFINIAGALSDWNAGRKVPKPNRFQDRPALIDEGILRKSITFSAPDAVTAKVGTIKNYALVHQEGGETEIPISSEAKKSIREWLYQTSKKSGTVFSKKKVTHHGRSGKGLKQKTVRSAYADKIEQLIYDTVWSQPIARRTFVGMTDNLEREIDAEIKKFFGGVFKTK